MDQKQIFKQMIDFNKASFDNCFSAMVLFQDQTERATNSMLNQIPWMPEESKKALQELGKNYKDGRLELKKSIDASFKMAEEYFGSGK